MIRNESPLRQTFHNPEPLTRRPVLAKAAQHNPETLRVFVSDWPPERGVFARVATGKRVSGEWLRPGRLHENTKKAGVLRCCKTPA